MNIAEMLVDEIDKQGRTNKWVAEQVDIKPVTFSLKVTKNRFNSTELVRIAVLLDLDLNIFKACIGDEEDEKL
ncbi:hypothetical protein [Paenibacillus sp. IHBB 10380]|uniref:hypothetical protein n=1 Tax=Paenibacillus sp. IHBB 10380 TaxID=1566358 RepID=UPI0005CF9BE1|nr:hypothetical protein [Paenibacillus sp. IHBB 10380]AJS59189.1 hypothetical protein UB51_12740 [Paenibacillus sp. IHBB 10380]